MSTNTYITLDNLTKFLDKLKSGNKYAIGPTLTETLENAGSNTILSPHKLTYLDASVSLDSVIYIQFADAAVDGNYAVQYFFRVKTKNSGNITINFIESNSSAQPNIYWANGEAASILKPNSIYEFVFTKASRTATVVTASWAQFKRV